MIRIRCNGLEDQIVTPTRFPDGTSQVWKLELDQYKDLSVSVIWNFNQEAELIWLNQLIDLLVMSDISVDEVYIPYLPYARQDKLIANDTTFAKRTFLDMLSVYHYNYTSLDVHSNKYSNHKVKSYSPKRYIDKAILKSEATILVFPDKGAYERYNDDFSEFPVIVLDKVRDQSTGNITGMALNMELTSRQITFTNDNTPFKCLIIDDICDGGATFIGASTFLHEKFDCEVALYVTHGIFSKGFQKMFESGIIEFYTTKSLVMNIDGYELEEV